MPRKLAMQGASSRVRSTCRFLTLGALIALSGIANASELFCGTATNQAHVSAGRAYQDGYVYAKANGSNDDMGMFYSDSAVLKETSPGYFEVVSECPPPVAGPYANASEVEMPTIVNITGKYDIAMGGNHFLENSGSDKQAFPREKIVGTSDTINIPAGSTIKYAFLYYGGIIGLDGGDFTADGLGSEQDVANNGISFKIDGQSYGTYDPTSRPAPGESEVGSNTILGQPVFHAEFGTLTGTSTSFWSNRVDITGVLQGKAGNLNIEVNPPEEIDVNVNNASSNGGNPAGSTVYNSCLNAANWAIVVVYENADLPTKNIILKDDLVRAWDYVWFHKGIWQRPIVKFEDHAPMKSGAKFYVIGQTGNKAGSATPSSPACTCGCGGTYNLEKGTGYDTPSNFWSNTLLDPIETHDDPLHRDRTNGPWKLVNQQGTGGKALRGNEWTLYQSGTTYTEFPNLYEGENVAADNIQPVTMENVPDAGGDTYDGHPWNGRGQVTYQGHGNDLSAIEVALDDAALDIGSTNSAFYFKGDQKDVFKPQARVTIRFLALSIPTDSDPEPTNQPPAITLTGGDVNLTAGDNYAEPGYSANDPEDGNITGNVVRSCDFNVNQALSAGNYSCTYNVSDSKSLPAPTKTRQVIVAEADNTAPVITLVGDNPFVMVEGNNYVEPGYSASDNEDGNLTASVQVSCTTDISVPLAKGTYVCTYSVEDSGQLDDEKTRTIIVNASDPQEDNAPTITLLGDNPVTFVEGADYVEPGYTASDVEDGNLTGLVSTACTFNASQPLQQGNYTCTYSVSDSADQPATAQRTVIVTAAPQGNDNAPVITITGLTSVTISLNSTYIDAGATAFDVEDGDLTSAIETNCNVNTSQAGEYSCVYTVDDNGSPIKSDTKTRTVFVAADDPPPPPASNCTDYSANLGTHRAFLRAYSTGLWWAPTYYATGSNEKLTGNYYTVVTLKTYDNEPGVYYPGSCE